RDWSSDVCSSDLDLADIAGVHPHFEHPATPQILVLHPDVVGVGHDPAHQVLERIGEHQPSAFSASAFSASAFSALSPPDLPSPDLPSPDLPSPDLPS